jgi:uncharacterized membrane protein YphA (DoxX/SURF4 family)
MLIVASIALLFASAGVHKLRDMRRFDEIFSAYGLMPALARLRVSRIVPILEIGVAAGLLIDVCRPYAGAVGIVMLWGYAAAIAVNLRRGRRDLACGCGGPDERRPISAWMVWRNILMSLALAVVLQPWASRPLGFTDGVTIVFGLLTITLVYLCTDRLLGYTQRTAQLRGSR